tara:strand:- start:128 stop:403 length:276 start_codon:yes stop_codon:yes gene_type:complete
MTEQKVVPIGRKVLIKKKEPEQFFEGTQIIRTDAVEDFIADIVAIGDLVDNLSVGDRVKYSEHSMGIEMKHEGEKVLLVNCDMIFAKIINV